MKTKVFSIRTDKAGRELFERLYLQIAKDEGYVPPKSVAFKKMLELLAEQKGIAA